MEKENNKEISPFAARFRAIRSHYKITQTGFAQMLGLKPRKISKYENEDLKISIELLEKLVLCGVNLNWFVSGKGEMFQAFSAPTFQDLSLTKENQEQLVLMVQEMKDMFVTQVGELGVQKTEKLVQLYNENKLLFDTFTSILEMTKKQELLESLEHLKSLLETKLNKPT